MAAFYFVVQRHHGDEFPALYFDYLPPFLTRKLPVDDKRKPIEQPPMSYALRLDRADPGNWSKRPLADVFGEFKALREIGALPQSNLADLPKKTEQGRELGNWYMAKSPPGFGLPPAPWAEPGTIQPRPQAGAFIPPGRDAE